MNTVECIPYAGRFSPAACAAFQKQSRAGCPCANAVQGVEPLKGRRNPGSMAGVNLYIEHGIRIENPATEGGRKRGRPPGAKRGENPFSTHFIGRPASQEPRAKSQEPRAKSQEPRAKSQEPRAGMKMNSNLPGSWPGWHGLPGAATAARRRCFH